MVFVVPVVGRGAGAVSAGEADDPVAGRAGRASTAGAVLAFSVALCARAAVRELALDALRRDVVGFVTCSWLSGVLGVALSTLVRVVRLRVAGFTCSLASGDSDVLVMKKTPFYLVIRHWFQYGPGRGQAHARTLYGLASHFVVGYGRGLVPALAHYCTKRRKSLFTAT